MAANFPVSPEMDLTVRENLVVRGLLSGLHLAPAQARALELITEFDLTAHARTAAEDCTPEVLSRLTAAMAHLRQTEEAAA